MAEDEVEEVEEDGAAAAEGDGDGDGDGAEPSKKKFSGKKIVLFIVLPLLLVIGGGGGAAYFLGLFGSDEEEHELAAEEAEAEVEPQIIFFDLPEILVNLSSTGKKETYLKIRISLELDDPTAPVELEPMMPRIIDSFQVFLREMRVEDLRGSAGMTRLKEELLRRINLSVQPIHVRDVLFKEMLVQ